MNATNELRVRKIRKFGGLARAACTACIAFTVLLAAPWGFYSIFVQRPGVRFALDIGPVSFSGDRIESLSLQIWIVVIVVLNLALFLRMLWHVRAVFDHLARGEIYTAGPVRRLRALGRLLLAGAGLQIIIPALTLLLAGVHVVEIPATMHYTARLSTSLFTGFAAAGVVMLLSWVLDVGLGLREEADELRRDAELVV